MKYEWEDVWVLASIEIAHNSDEPALYYKKNITLPSELLKFKNIYQVIATGDFINHAIFLVDELVVGIKKLLTGEFIKVENDHLKPSRKTLEYYGNAVGDRKRISRDTALKIFARMLDVELDWL